MIDAPNGGGFLEIETASKTFSLRCADSSVLHAWRRELYELLPYLRATEVKCGWLYKKGEGSNAGFKKRYCVLFSSYRLLYFESEACTKRKGAVDLSVAESVDSVSTPKGHGFEISTPGRTWARPFPHQVAPRTRRGCARSSTAPSTCRAPWRRTTI